MDEWCGQKDLLAKFNSAIYKHHQRFRLIVQVKSITSTTYFQLAFVSGWAISEFPAFTNTQTLENIRWTNRLKQLFAVINR